MSRKIVRWVAGGGLATLLAAVAALTGNMKSIKDTAAPWVESWLRPQSVIQVSYMGSSAAPVLLSLTEGGKLTDVRSTVPGQVAEFRVPAHIQYGLIWQGTGIVPAASATNIPAAEGFMHWRLFEAQQDEKGRIILSVEFAANSVAPTRPAPAALLFESGARQQARQSEATPLGNAVLPELHRVLTVVGLLETGTTNCSTSVFVSDNDAYVGCLAYRGDQFYRIVEEALKITPEVDRQFRTISGTSDVSLEQLRHFLNTIPFSAAGDENIRSPQNMNKMRTVLQDIVQHPEIRIAMEEDALRRYKQAVQAANLLDIRSQQGALIVFYAMIQRGGRIIQLIDQPYRIHLSANPEMARSIEGRIAALVHVLFARMREYETAEQWLEVWKRQYSLLVTGRGTYNGIDFSLQSVGIPIP